MNHATTLLSVVFLSIVLTSCAHQSKKNTDAAAPQGLKAIAALSEDGLSSQATSTVELKYSYQAAWDLAQNVVRRMGVITFEDPIEGSFRANVRKSKVQVMVKKLAEKEMRIQVNAEHEGKPAPDLSAEIVQAMQS